MVERKGAESLPQIYMRRKETRQDGFPDALLGM